MGDVLIKMAQVESIHDDADGLRIKARLSQDGNISTKELPYSFPLLPKTIQSVPKVGECVLVFFSEIGNNNSNRYYIGPIISQPQFNSYDPYMYGRGTAISLLKGASVSPLEKISNYDLTRGSYPNVNDVALVGRNTEDVILKDGEIDLAVIPIKDDIIIIEDVRYKVLQRDIIMRKNLENQRITLFVEKLY